MIYISYIKLCSWGYSSVGRALASHARGLGFDSLWLHLLLHPAPFHSLYIIAGVAMHIVA